MEGSLFSHPTLTLGFAAERYQFQPVQISQGFCHHLHILTGGRLLVSYSLITFPYQLSPFIPQFFHSTGEYPSSLDLTKPIPIVEDTAAEEKKKKV